MANYHLVQQRGALCNFPAKIGQSEMNTVEVAVWHKNGDLGKQMATSSGVENHPLSPWRPRTTNGDQKGDVDVTRGAKRGVLGVNLVIENRPFWGANNGPTGKPVGWPLIPVGNRPPVGRFGTKSGRLGFGEG